MKKLLLLFSVIITLSHAQVDWRTRQWVMNYLRSGESTIDTVWMHYTDSLYVRVIIASSHIDADSGDFDHMVVNTHIWVDSLYGDDIVANWGVFDTLYVITGTDTTKIRGTAVESDSILGMYFVFHETNDTLISSFTLGDTITALYVVHQGTEDAHNLHGIHVRAQSITGTYSGHGVVGGFFQADSTGSDCPVYGVVGRAIGGRGASQKLVGLEGYVEVNNNDADDVDMKAVVGKTGSCGSGKKYCFYGQAADALTSGDSTWVMYGTYNTQTQTTNSVMIGTEMYILGGAGENDTCVAFAGFAALGAVNIGGQFNPNVLVITGTDTTEITGTTTKTTNSTVDSVDAQHVVADGHVQTDSIASVHAVIDTFNQDVVVKGAVKPAAVVWNLLQDNVIGVVQNSVGSGNIYGSLQGLTADSIIIDSIGIVEVTTHADVYIDSFNLFRGFTRAGDERTTSLYGNGTDMGAGTGAYGYHNYTTNITVASTWRMMFTFWVDTSGTAGAGYIISLKIYGHYQ